MHWACRHVYIEHIQSLSWAPANVRQKQNMLLLSIQVILPAINQNSESLASLPMVNLDTVKLWSTWHLNINFMLTPLFMICWTFSPSWIWKLVMIISQLIKIINIFLNGFRICCFEKRDMKFMVFISSLPWFIHTLLHIGWIWLGSTICSIQMINRMLS